MMEGSFYGEEAFITTLEMMVEDNGDVTVNAAANSQRKEGMRAVSECHCLELGIRDVFDAFGGNRNVLRLLARYACVALPAVKERNATYARSCTLNLLTCICLRNIR